jgi:hypothetical protein
MACGFTYSRARRAVMRKQLLLGTGLLAGACALTLLVSAVEKVRDAADRAH